MHEWREERGRGEIALCATCSERIRGGGAKRISWYLRNLMRRIDLMVRDVGSGWFELG